MNLLIDLLADMRTGFADLWQRQGTLIAGVTGGSAGAWSVWFDKVASFSGKLAAIGGAILTAWAIHDKLRRDTKWYPRLLKFLFRR